MKKYAFFLPQYHEIPENNQWWEEGFTEWSNVKRAKPLYKDHQQPKVPLNNNYYCLLDKKVVEQQTEIMNQYGIDGMIYYHYYFTGRKLLEKPAENLLKWKDIKQNFFFCWANHSWKKTWQGTSEILLEQVYGTQQDWKKHFDYLLPFFKDKRYVKIDNKPVFMLYISEFPERKEIFNYWEKLCIDNGFNGIYLIETYCFRIEQTSFKKFIKNLCKQTVKVYLREPDFSLNLYKKYYLLSINNIKNKCIGLFNKLGISTGVKKYSGSKLMKILLKYEPMRNNIIHGLFFEFDNTARHKKRGQVISPIHENDLANFMKNYNETEFIVINAWNEWAEGMMLEPSEQNGYKYLEWLKKFN